MKTIRQFSLFAVVIAVLAVFALPAAAQAEREATLTEEEINNWWRLEHNRFFRLSDTSVDLVSGAVIVDTTVTLHRAGESFPASFTATPFIDNGRIFWTVTTISYDDNVASDEVIAQVNAVIENSWQRFIRQQARAGVFTSIDISDSEITLTATFEGRRNS